MLFRRKRDFAAEIREIFEEGAEIENIHFEPIGKLLAQSLKASGLPQSQMRRALKAGLDAAKRTHVDHNLAAFNLDDLNSRPHLGRPLPLRRGVTTTAYLFLLLMNAVAVGGMVYAALRAYELTARLLMATGAGLLAVLVLSYAIRFYVTMTVRMALRFQRPLTPEEITSRKREEDARAHVRRESPPPIATTPATARKIGARRFQLGVVKAVARYAVLVIALYLFVRNARLAMVIGAVPVVVLVTYTQLQPLRTAFDALVFGILHPPMFAFPKRKSRRRT
jgi:hypothetical protein